MPFFVNPDYCRLYQNVSGEQVVDGCRVASMEECGKDGQLWWQGLAVVAPGEVDMKQVVRACLQVEAESLERGSYEVGVPAWLAAQS